MIVCNIDTSTLSVTRLEILFQDIFNFILMLLYNTIYYSMDEQSRDYYP